MTHNANKAMKSYRTIGSCGNKSGITDARMPAEKFSYALNTRLPQDIRIQDSCQVPEDFHPRFQETITRWSCFGTNRGNLVAIRTFR